MGSSNQEATRFEYRNHAYKLETDRDVDVLVKVFKKGTSDVLRSAYFCGLPWIFRCPKKAAKRAVLRAHRFARDYIDRRVAVNVAINEVDPFLCRWIRK